ncbi:MAG: AAA family ATPase [Erysipelotrichaceae bacterium]|nr:AAA family ATPase [Erysipelotrichaceae bacterium]
MKTISIYNIKGGTGKTTAAKTIATGMALEGKKICLIDLDPQGNTGKTFMYEEDQLDLCNYEYKHQDEKINTFIYEYLNQEKEDTICDIFDLPSKITTIIRKTSIETLDIIPSNLYLSLIDTKIRLSDGRQENYISKALREIRNRYDYVIIDCSPVKSLLTVNAIYASDYVLIPVTIDDDSKQGLAMTLKEIKALEELYDLEIDWRVLINMKQKTRLQDENVKFLRFVFGDKLLKTLLCYQSNPITTATQQRKTILEFKEKRFRESHIANDYRNLLKELEELL